MLLKDCGKIGVESKKSMKTRGVKSPNRGDSFVYCLYEPSNIPQIASAFNYSEVTINPNVKIDNCDIADLYGSCVCLDNLNIYVMVGAYIVSKRTIKIIHCEKIEISDLNEYAEKLKKKLEPFEILHWYGNEAITESVTAGNKGIWYALRKAGIKVRFVYLKTPIYLYKTINNLFLHKRLHINSDLEGLISNLRHWRIENGKSNDDLPFINLLIQFMSGLMQQKHIKHYII
jgi:hypothetical protein